MKAKQSKRRSFARTHVEKMLRVLASGRRVDIVLCLTGKSMDVASIARKLKVSRATVGRDLGVLLRHSLVQVHAKGVRRIYTLGTLPQRRVQAKDPATRIACPNNEHIVFNRRRR